jgi:hypothetical protein
MAEEPALIKVAGITEEKDGSVTYKFDISDGAREKIIDEGLRLILYCGTAGVDLQDVYDWILSQAGNPDGD